MKIAATTYSAFRGYAWSSIPDGLSVEALDDFCRIVTEARGDFCDSVAVDVGLVSDGRLAAVYTRQNVANWDSAGRASDYFAFAFFPIVLAGLFDFVELISNDFFWTPSRTPATSVDYDGRGATQYPAELAETLRHDGRGVLEDPRAVGTLIASLGQYGERWSCRLRDGGGAFDINCNTWK